METKYQQSIITQRSNFDEYDQGGNLQFPIDFQNWTISDKNFHQQKSIKNALNKQTGKICSVKIIDQIKLASTHNDSIKIISTIPKHPNIIQYYGVSKQHNQLYIFMEHIQKSLRSFINEYGPLENDIFMKFAKQIILGLQCLHQHHINYKDIQSSNIFIMPNGVVKLGASGDNKLFDESLIQDNNIEFGGTILWMSPQTIRQEIFNDKSDIWSLGCTLIQLATAKLPWHDKKFQNNLSAINHIGQNKFIPQEHKKQHIHVDIKTLINCCLNIDPQQRKNTDQLLQLELWDDYE